MISDPSNQFPSRNPTLSANKWQSHSSHVHPHLLSGEHKAPAAKHGREHDAAAFVAPAVPCSPLGHWQPLFKPSHRNPPPLHCNLTQILGRPTSWRRCIQKLSWGREGGCAPEAALQMPALKPFMALFILSEQRGQMKPTERIVCAHVCVCVHA